VPSELPNNAYIEAAAWYQPHSQVGGDHYDLIPLSDGTFMACVADVSGQGIAAALMMSNFQANLQASVRHNTDLTELVHELNGRVQANARGERFITLFIGHIDPVARRITYVNCGHNHPLLLTPKGIVPLNDGCIALGMMPRLPFLKVGQQELPPGSTLLCYTDGLVEQEDAHGNAFDTAPIHKALQQFQAAGPQAINDTLIATFEAHRAGLPYLDDIALLTCCFS